MANVKFYRLSQLPTPYVAASHQGVFVHLTQADSTHPVGLWFGGTQGWEYLTNDPNAVKIDEKSLKRATAGDATDFDIEQGSIYVKDDFIDTTFTTTTTVGYLGQGATVQRGTTVEALLKQILTKLLHPKVSASPTAALNFGTYEEKTVFVGANITFPTASITTTNGTYQSKDPSDGTDFSSMVSQPETGVFFNHEKITTSVSNCNYNTEQGSAEQGSDSSTDVIESGSVLLKAQTVAAKLGVNTVTYNATAHHTASTSTGLNSDNTAASLSIAAGDTSVTSSGASKKHTGVLPLYVNYVGEKRNSTHDGSNVSNSWVQSAGTGVSGVGKEMQQVSFAYNVTSLVFSVLGQNGGKDELVTIYYPAGTVKKVEVFDSGSGQWKNKPDYLYNMKDNVTMNFGGIDYTYHGLVIRRSDSPAKSDYRVTFSEGQAYND